MSFVSFPVGNCEAVIHGLLDGIPTVNTLGAKFISGSPTSTDGAALAAALEAWWVAELQTSLTTVASIESVTVYDLSSPSGWVANVTAHHAGTGGGTAVPNNVAMTITFQTAQRGRSFRGRNYLGGLATAVLADQKTWASGAISIGNNAYGALPTAMAAVGFNHEVLSRRTGKAQRLVGVSTGVLNYRANAPVHTIRGRLK